MILGNQITSRAFANAVPTKGKVTQHHSGLNKRKARHAAAVSANNIQYFPVDDFACVVAIILNYNANINY